MTEFIIPGTLVDNLATIPADRPVALLLRHSVRDPIPDGESGRELPLTDRGVELAQQLGEKLKRRLASLHTSPVPRCVETAECLRDGAGVDSDIHPDRLLGDPGVFVEDRDLARKTFQKKDYWDIVAGLIAGEDLPGMRHGPSALRRLTGHMLEKVGRDSGLHVFVTHDMFIASLVFTEFTEGVERELSPWFLDGVFLWEDDEIGFRYRDLETRREK